MVTKIFNIYTYHNDEITKYDIDIVLRIAEEFGMAPPDSDYYRSSLVCPNRVWEPENEEA